MHQHVLVSFHIPYSLENALLDEPGVVNTLLEQVVLRFILNLRPNTRNTSSELLPATLQSVLHELLKDKDRLRERTVFWDYDADTNVMPLKDLEGGFWFASWDLKLRILRQLVDWQLHYSSAIRDVIDTAWQFRQKPHKKKAEAPKPPPSPGAPNSREGLRVAPIGQDKDRTRFWIADNSPRLYASNNPWKVAQTFRCVAQTREDYIEWIEKLRASAPPEQEEGNYEDHRHHLHWELIYALEMRVDEVQRALEDEDNIRKQREAVANAAPTHRVSRSYASLLSETEVAVREEIQAAEDWLINRTDVQSGDEVPDTRETTPGGHEEDGAEVTKPTTNKQYEQYDAEYDELQDDPSLIIESDAERKPAGKKRRRRLTPVSQKPTRVSARKRARHGEAEGSAPTEIAPALAMNGHGPQSEPNDDVAPLEPKQPEKSAKGRNAKFWYFDQVEGPPAKRPDMVDNPDAILKRKRTRKTTLPIELDPQINGNPAPTIAVPMESTLQTTEG